MVKTNQFIDDDNLTELSSLTHLLDRNEEDDTEDIPVLKHSPFYSELQFTDLITPLSIISSYTAFHFAIHVYNNV